MTAMWAFVATALVFGSGCAKQDWIDRTLVTADVSGVWTGSVASHDGQTAISFELRLELRQNATKVTGSFEPTTVPLGLNTRGVSPIEGRVANDVFTFEVQKAILTGELTIDGDEMRGNGLAGNSRQVTITLRRVEVATPAGSPPR